MFPKHTKQILIFTELFPSIGYGGYEITRREPSSAGKPLEGGARERRSDRSPFLGEWSQRTDRVGIAGRKRASGALAYPGRGLPRFGFPVSKPIGPHTDGTLGPGCEHYDGIVGQQHPPGPGREGQGSRILECTANNGDRESPGAKNHGSE